MFCSPISSPRCPTIYNQRRWVHVSDTLIFTALQQHWTYCRYCHLLGWNEKISICNWWKGKIALHESAFFRNSAQFYLPILSLCWQILCIQCCTNVKVAICIHWKLQLYLVCFSLLCYMPCIVWYLYTSNVNAFSKYKNTRLTLKSWQSWCWLVDLMMEL